VILDGSALARARAGSLAVRADALATRLGRAPRLILLAFANEAGHAPFIERKLRACRAAGVEVVSLILPPGTTDAEAGRLLQAALDRQPVDGVFLEFPFPEGIDEAALCGLVPEVADIDVMTAGQVAAFFAQPDASPPLTVSAGLELLDRAGVDLSGRTGFVVGPDIPFTRMFREAFARRGARMHPVVAPDDPALRSHVKAADVVVVAASRPGVLQSTDFAPGAILLDAGYFNPGGRGDVDLAGGVDHLAALVPVPGGVGPMTVSVLVERVIAAAERSCQGLGPHLAPS